MARHRRQILIAVIPLVTLLIGGFAAAATQDVQIDVTFTPLTFLFNGIQKSPPVDQPPFLYGGRTYVPLRFMAESMGDTVNYDGATSTISVVRGQSADQTTGQPHTPRQMVNWPFAINQQWRYSLSYMQWDATPRNKQNVNGEEMASPIILTSVCASCSTNAEVDSVYEAFSTGGQYKTISGILFVPAAYTGRTGDFPVGKLRIYNSTDFLLYESPTLYASMRPATLPFSVNIDGAQEVRVELVTYLNPTPESSADRIKEFTGGNVTSTGYWGQIGIASFGFD